MAQLKSRLMLEVNTCRVLLNKQVLPVNQHWFYIYALLALRFAEGNPVVGLTELNRLPTWESVAEKSLRTSLFRHASEVSAGVITSPPNERTKRFLLNSALVSTVKFDVSLEEVSSFLQLAGRATPPSPPPNVLEAQASAKAAGSITKLLGFAEVAFEQGRYEDTLRFTGEVLARVSSSDDRVYALCLRAWTYGFIGQRDLAWTAILELQASRDDPSTSRVRVALTWIQEARFFLRFRDARAARRAYKAATALLTQHHHREWSAIHAGLGYLASWTGKHTESLRHSLLALEYASQAHWTWSVQVQHNNISSAYFRLFEQHEQRQPQRAMRHLTEAERWVRESMEFCDQMDLGGATDNEVNLAFALRVQGKYDEARVWLTRAANVSNASNNDVDRALVRAETAELEEALGVRDQAIEHYRVACALFEQLVLDDWGSACQVRLEELLGKRPLTKPLKLW